MTAEPGPDPKPEVRAVPTMTEGDPRNYTEQAAVFDKLVDQKLAGIRRAEDAGDLTVCQAAELRIAALEHHIEAVRNLRIEFFGDGAS